MKIFLTIIISISVILIVGFLSYIIGALTMGEMMLEDFKKVKSLKDLKFLLKESFIEEQGFILMHIFLGLILLVLIIFVIMLLMIASYNLIYLNL